MASLASSSLSANPPLLSFPSTTPTTIHQEAIEIKEKFTKAIQDVKQRCASNNNNNNNNIGDGGINNDAFASLSLALGEASAASARITLPSMIHGDAAVRAASNVLKDDFKNMFDAALSDEGLYEAIILQLQNNDGGDDGSVSISSSSSSVVDEEEDEDERFRRTILRTLRRNGCALESNADRMTVRAKRRQIEEDCTAFCSTINEHDEFLLFTEEELHGIDDINQFPTENDETKTDDTAETETNTKKQKRRIVGLKAPDTQPILKFATNPTTRKRIYQSLSKKCQAQNTCRFLNVLKLRNECANLLGYESHAEYMCEVKMVGCPKKAEDFLLELMDAYGPIREGELELLRERKRKDVAVRGDGGGGGNGNGGGGDDVSLDPWDIAYYTRVYNAECAGVDEAKLRQYFPLEHVKTTILSIYEELLGLKFERVLDANVWHDDVECYAVRSSVVAATPPQGNSDNTNGEGSFEDDDDDLLGHFYLDIFPRKGKYSHQCVYPLRPSYQNLRNNNNNNNNAPRRVLPACVNIGNLTPSRDGAPSLLLFREVETFFHEFGHACHCVLTNSRHSLHSWAWSAVPWPGGVEQDFLEVPSMMLENFVWTPEVLRRLSRNVADGSQLPELTIGALSESRFRMTGYAKCKYLAMSLYDLKVHGGSGPYYEFEGKEYDAVSLYNVMIEKYTGIAPMPDSFSAASWFHLMMGYDAGYYGYIYSETFAADLFSKFEELSRENKSVLDVDLGKKYRDKILSPCATTDGEVMLLDFLGREPSKDAFLASRI